MEQIELLHIHPTTGIVEQIELLHIHPNNWYNGADKTLTHSPPQLV